MSEKRFKEYLDYAIGVGIIVELTLGGLILFYIANQNLLGGYWTNIVSTIIGAALTIVILDKRNDHRAEREFKERLILQMGSPDAYKTGNESDFLHWVFSYVSLVLQWRVVKHLMKADDAREIVWVNTNWPEVAKEANLLLQVIDAHGFDTPEKMKFLLDYIFKRYPLPPNWGIVPIRNP